MGYVQNVIDKVFDLVRYGLYFVTNEIECVGKPVFKVVQPIRKIVLDVVNQIGNKILDVVSPIRDRLNNICQCLCDFLAVKSEETCNGL